MKSKVVIIQYCMKYILKTTYPCLVKTQDDQCELEENDMLEIEDESLVFIYPENPAQIPFYINMNSPKESVALSVIARKNDTLLILESAQKMAISHKEMLIVDGKKCEVCVRGQKISFESEEKKVEYFCPHPCGEHKILKIGNFACVQFNEHLYAFSPKKNRLTHFDGQAEIDGATLLLTKHFHDSEERERHAKYVFKEDIVMEEESFSRNENRINKDLAPYKLMESVKAKDFEFAHSLLSEKLKTEINSAQIREFFGNFSSFLPLSTTEFITISGAQKNYVKFNLHENLIDDITVDAL